MNALNAATSQIDIGIERGNKICEPQGSRHDKVYDLNFCNVNLFSP